jgi:hypothetical protein
MGRHFKELLVDAVYKRMEKAAAGNRDMWNY